jgi:hypothetical protein
MYELTGLLTAGPGPVSKGHGIGSCYSREDTGGRTPSLLYYTLLPKITHYESLLWPADSTKFSGALREGRPFVLYLHGNVDTPPLVITHDDCARQAQTFRDNELRLETTLAAHTLTVNRIELP